MSTLLVPSAFHGPPGSGNGGWCAGAIAAVCGTGSALGRTVEVTLRLPPPLEVPLPVQEEDGVHTAVDPEGRMDLSMAFVGTRSMFERVGFAVVGTTDAVASRMPRLVMRRTL